jgi:hypothetical protein
MPSLAAMADAAPTTGAAKASPPEPGAPVARDEIDPELVNLRKGGPRIGAVTAAGVAILCVYLIVRLVADLGFSREGDKPTPIKLGEVDGDMDNKFVEIALPIERGRAVRLRQQQAGIGLRAAPVAGANNGLWVVMTGNGWAPAVPNAAYAGRIRDLDDLPLAEALRDHVAAHPGPAFATLPAVRTAFGSGELITVSGDTVKITASDPVAIDVPVPDAAVVVVTFSKRFPGQSVWVTALAAAGIEIKGAPRDVTEDTARIDVIGDVAAVTAKLDAAQIYARVEPVTTTLATTWAELAKHGTGPITIEGTPLPDASIDLIRITANRHIPSDARVLVVGEVPEDYWYVLPLVIGLGLLGLIALWALARAIKRDYLAPKLAATPSAAS